MASSTLGINLLGKYQPFPTLRHLRLPVRTRRRRCTFKALSLCQPPEFPKVPPDSKYPPKPPPEMPNMDPVPGFEPNFPNEVPEVGPSPEIEQPPPNIDPPLTPPRPSPGPDVPHPPDLVPPMPDVPRVPDDVPHPGPPQISPQPPAPPEGSPLEAFNVSGLFNGSEVDA